MKVGLGNFQQEPIQSFYDREGNDVTYPEYLKSYGLYSSRTHLYLMTTAKTANNVDQSLANESHLFTENDSVVVKDVVLARASDGPDQSQSSSSMVSFSENQVLLPSAVMGKTKTCTRLAG